MEFGDAGASDTHTAVWNWGDGTTSAGTVAETDGSGTVTGGHTYDAAGVYTVTVRVEDDTEISSDTVSVTMNNVAPTVNAGPDQNPDEGETVETRIGMTGMLGDGRLIQGEETVLLFNNPAPVE